MSLKFFFQTTLLTLIVIIIIAFYLTFIAENDKKLVKIDESEKKNNVSMESETSSELINIADAVLFYGGTSIILEALAKEKIVACIDYLDCNRNIFEYFKSCHNLRCRDDLCFFLNSIKFNKTRPISGKKLLQEIVYARDESSSVPTRYINFFQNL